MGAGLAVRFLIVTNHPLQVNLDPPPPHHHPIYSHFFQNEPTLMFAVPLAAPVRWQPEMGYQLGQLFQKKGSWTLWRDG
jgi:hypothetical protein